jgi:hypothetical protein
MHVQFEFTRDDLIDVSQRFSARSKVMRSWKTSGMFWSAVLTWLVVFAFFFSTPLKGAVVGLVAAIVCALIYPVFYKRGVKKRISKLNDEILGNETSLLCGVDIDQDGFTVTQMNRRIQYDWLAVTEISETAESVDIFSRDGGGVIVRNRAFESDADRAKFVELAKTFFSQARS